MLPANNSGNMLSPSTSDDKCIIARFEASVFEHYNSIIIGVPITFHKEKTKRVYILLHKKATIHQLTIMLSTSKNLIFPDHNHQLITDADDLTLYYPLSEGDN